MTDLERVKRNNRQRQQLLLGQVISTNKFGDAVIVSVFEKSPELIQLSTFLVIPKSGGIDYYTADLCDLIWIESISKWCLRSETCSDILAREHLQ